MAITHTKVSAKPDSTNTALVQPSDWNAAHTIAAGTIVNADINASAAIAKSKLAALDVVNADVNASAAIAVSKLADGTAYQTLRTNSAGNGVEWGYKLYVGASEPSGPSTGDIWIDTTP